MSIDKLFMPNTEWNRIISTVSQKKRHISALIIIFLRNSVAVPLVVEFLENIDFHRKYDAFSEKRTDNYNFVTLSKIQMGSISDCLYQ